MFLFPHFGRVLGSEGREMFTQKDLEAWKPQQRAECLSGTWSQHFVPVQSSHQSLPSAQEEVSHPLATAAEHMLQQWMDFVQLVIRNNLVSTFPEFIEDFCQTMIKQHIEQPLMADKSSEGPLIDKNCTRQSSLGPWKWISCSCKLPFIAPLVDSGWPASTSSTPPTFVLVRSLSN